MIKLRKLYQKFGLTVELSCISRVWPVILEKLLLRNILTDQDRNSIKWEWDMLLFVIWHEGRNRYNNNIIITDN